jgi:aldehyde dehydrogenase (NAD+)
MSATYQNYVSGSWIDSDTGDVFEVSNPADKTDTVGTFPDSSREDAKRAIAAAKTAQASWADTPGPERGRILRETAARIADRKQEFAETLTREEGKPLAESLGGIKRAINIFYYYAEKARDFSGTKKSSSSQQVNLYTVREPIGVAGLITPWNYPVAIPAWKIAPALATGNTVVFKPAKVTPTVAVKLVECLVEAGIPKGVVNLVIGSGSTVGDEFVTNAGVDAVSFTGSASVGTDVYQSATADGKRAQCEMGGKNPTIVMPSADIDKAASIVASGAFGGTGQACTACSRAIVHEDVHNEFINQVIAQAESIDVGPGLEGFDMGPHVGAEELQGTLDYIEIGKEEGATLETGGKKLTGGRFSNGHFVQPTVFSDVTPEMRIAQEEIFGPVLSVIDVSDFETAIDVANGVEYGLSASIVTQEHTEANRFVDEIEAGVAKINEKTTGLELHVPFGGFKRSSTETFREQGDAGLEFYTLSKTVYDNY